MALVMVPVLVMDSALASALEQVRVMALEPVMVLATVMVLAPARVSLSTASARVLSEARAYRSQW